MSGGQRRRRLRAGAHLERVEAEPDWYVAGTLEECDPSGADWAGVGDCLSAWEAWVTQTQATGDPSDCSDGGPRGYYALPECEGFCLPKWG